ncbi:DUF6441 family protein [Hahella sp. CR1]|uniref:DUF6441 family protein n=1 Tax=Hahella sp. CR1 TaxID=2992807 RepID=UPI00244148FC|nr:DUF6441 family protein [Hahella sp. CR1]MDG9670881.1 DUF6441 family protein [Hahella sp. CR1]
MRIDLVADGLLDRRRFNAWRKEKRQAVHSAVGKVMRASGRDMVTRVRDDMRRGFSRTSPALLRSVRAKVYDAKSNQLPALWVGSKIPWLGVHERGKVIRGRMLIPLLPAHQRIGRKAFARLVDDLRRANLTAFVKRHGKLILMAHSTPESSRVLSRFRRAERERLGVRRLTRGEAIPIAVLVSKVTLKKRFDLQQSVRAELPRLTASLRVILKRL